VRNPETAQSVGFIWVFPLVFASSAFVPTASMPGIVHTFGDVNPITLTVNASRAMTIGHGHAVAPLLGTLAWLVALLLVVFVPLAIRAFERS
jgi:ABC-2 type transport system permease protein/oleandomycin transport system permease protein